MVKDRLVLLVDGSGTVVASETTMFYQDELGGGLHGWRVGPFSPICNYLVGIKIGSWAE